MQQPPTQDSAPVRRPVKAGFFGLTVGRPIAMGVLFVTLILLGAIAYTRIPLQFLPGGIQGTRFSIIVPNPGASAQENVDKVARIQSLSEAVGFWKEKALKAGRRQPILVE